MHMRRSLWIYFVTAILGACIGVAATSAYLAATADAQGVQSASNARGGVHAPGWHVNRVASYYKLFGRRTACGVIMDDKVQHVAALKPELAHCGMRVRICHAGRCAVVRVKDRGKWRKDRRDWDLTPALKRRLKCGDLCTVNWKKEPLHGAR